MYFYNLNKKTDQFLFYSCFQFFSVKKINLTTADLKIFFIFQLAMYILQLGAVSALLSETLVSGFTTGAVIHVLSSQIKDLLGLNIPKFKGYFTVFNVGID